MTDSHHILAIVPAAGRGRRMTTTDAAAKALLPVKGQPMLTGVVRAILDGGADQVMVVVNAALQTQWAFADERVSMVVNDDPDTDMITSVRLALTAYEQKGVTEHDGILVCPCDAAGLSAADVRPCIRCFSRNPQRVIIASHAGQRGHPIIFPAAMISQVHAPLCDKGLNQLPREHAQQVIEVPCDSPGTVRNVNTPDDYKRLQP